MAGKPIEALWELTAKTFMETLLKLTRCELYLSVLHVSPTMREQEPWKACFQKSTTRKGPPYLLQCPSSTLY